MGGCTGESLHEPNLKENTVAESNPRRVQIATRLKRYMCKLQQLLYRRSMLTIILPLVDGSKLIVLGDENNLEALKNRSLGEICPSIIFSEVVLDGPGVWERSI
ncbi:hypothetical protein AGABI1DRAFT_95394 [Agaricus bisporus var. burnettii JB137-S8]|uniref:Uncharacterized protein n=1 Tax=Agaricus bisporus var. burnettii (strain JB137-S8 / ATCC MYA-4627 / FGSC 10392) TaxID=597362 RepID=K5WVG7_AGABU|nr:uncharacterized protein AGABI1DRAFT_95394 [Agaricus bisporus var. burnettii JB137-S8]EKM74773.1 hypothetical protein AGABI1DRAFT_95394 [Agaricus bisporus var. burnettii JB137-S8]